MDLVLYHHNHTKSNYPDLCSILKKADHHSASEREDIDDTQEVNKTPLISLFSKIVLEGNDKVDEQYIILIYDRIMNICKYLCHQKPERSFFYKEKQFPVCSRCTGIVIGAAAGFVLASLTQPNLIFVLGFIPLIIDGTTQYYGLRTSNNTLRFVTGLLCGFSIPFVVFKTESVILNYF